MTLIITRRMMASAALLVSSLMAACGPHSTNPSTETLTINQDAPTLNPLDLGPPGNSPGDVYYFSAPLRSSPGGRVIGEVFGSKTLIKPATDAKPNLEQRATLLIFTFSNREDQIVVMGFLTIRETPPNLMRVNPLCARYWEEPESTWVRVAN